MIKNLNIAFFGTSEFSVIVLQTLKERGVIPSLVVTAPDKPQGRNLILTPPPAKTWALENKIAFVQPTTLKNWAEIKELSNDFDLFVVAAYGLLIPESLFNLPKYKTLNIHPSLLPKYRGSSPLQSAILADDKHTGVSVMLIDREMDHGAVVAARETACPMWPPQYETFETIQAQAGANLLADIIPDWVSGKIHTQEQNHSAATFTTKIKKEDGQISLSENPYKNFLKIQAFNRWPGTFFFAKRAGKEIRVKIKKAKFENDELIIERVIPEGKKEMDYADFLRTAQME